MRYRPDIDGLRGVAVLVVVLFHAGSDLFSGGFIGVDVFFVISGYLITSIILADLRRGTFSLVAFYDRRIRRIFPALFTVVLCSSIIASLVLLPYEFRDFGRSVWATAMFASNVLFWRQSGYFDAPAESKPLLHTWSLAVEEQFYVFFPLFLLLVYRLLGRRLTLAILPCGLASLALSVWGTANAPIAAFYLAPSRAWELFLGALLAVGALPPLRQAAVRQALPLFGLGLIAWSAVTFSDETPFPGLSALLPCLGTALVIYAGQHGSTIVGRFLGAPPLLFVGLISYSLYLWHWPLLVFARYDKGDALSLTETTAVLALSFLASVLSWRYIEQPFRRRRVATRRQRLFVGAAAVTVCSFAFGAFADLTRGWPMRFSPEVVRISMAADTSDIKDDPCIHQGQKAILSGRACEMGMRDPALPVTVAVLGDSHAQALYPALDAVMAERKIKGIFLAFGGCAPLREVRSDVKPVCKQIVEAALATINRHPMITTVILAAQWSAYSSGYRYAERRRYYYDDQSTERSLEENRRVFKRGLLRTLAGLRGKRVVIVAPVPEHKFFVPHLAKYIEAGEDGPNTAYEDYLQRNAYVHEVFAELDGQVAIVEPAEVLCDGRSCKALAGDNALYRDRSHLSVQGALLLSPLLSSALAE